MAEAAPPGTRHGRRRPRSRSVTVDGGSRCEPDGISRARLLKVPAAAQNIDVDAILESRQKDGLPEADDVDDAAHITESEVVKAHEDIYGRPPPNVARSEERLLTLEREVKRLPESERKALTRALQHHPLLFVNCPHTKQFLEQDEGEFDAAAAARRLARYWEARRALFGERVCYASGTFADPSLVDFQRYYARTMAILNDPDTDQMARDDARALIDTIHKAKVKATNECLRHTQAECIEAFNPENPDSDADAEQFLKETAFTMAIDSPYELKLRFLHVEDFIEGNAASRMVRYFVTGLRLFGWKFYDQKAVTMEDMEDCSALFNVGLMRLMPSEDDFGRSVLVFRKVVAEKGEGDSNFHLTEERLLQLGIKEDHFAKVVWYMLHAALERGQCQQNGIVLVLDLRDVTRRYFTKFKNHRLAISEVLDCVPVKVRAVHCLLGLDHPLWRTLLKGLFSILVIAVKRRFVVHACALENALEELNTTYGIKAGNLPVDLGGTVDAEYFMQWVENRRAGDD